MILAVVPEWPVLGATDRSQVIESCMKTVRGQLRLAPLHIRVGFSVLLMTFEVFVLLTRGPFVSLRSRSNALAKFSELPLPMVAGLERVLRSTVVLAFFEHPAVLAALGEDALALRQKAFRDKRSGLLQSTL